MVLSLGRCQHGMVLIPREMSTLYGFVPREMSTWYGFDPSGGVEMVWSVPSGGVEMVWFDPSGGVEMVWFNPSGDAWSDSGNSGDVRGCVIQFQKRLYGLDPSGDVGMIWVTREMQSSGGLPRET